MESKPLILQKCESPLSQYSLHIDIPNIKEISFVNFYTLDIKFQEKQWQVDKRYSDFFNLHC